jgi:rRNA maturation RNase YbeY
MEVNLYWSAPKNLKLGDSKKLNNLIHLIPEIPVKFFPLSKKIQADLLNIIIVDDEKMKELNKTFRKKNKTTDVITFAFEEKHDKKSGPNTAEIYISSEQALLQSAEHNLTLLNEFIILIVHGLVHAFGYDHEESETEKIKMKGIENKILEYLQIKDIPPLTN